MLAITADVTREDDCARMVAQTVDAWGSLDIAVVNAGVGGPVARIFETTVEDWQRTLEVNLTAHS